MKLSLEGSSISPEGRRPLARDEIAGALAEMPYGLYIVGSSLAGEVNGMMADWVMQVSFEPRLIAVSMEKDARTLENVKQTGAFSVSLLPEDSMALAAKFAQPYYGFKIQGRAGQAAAEVHHKFEGVPYWLTESECPVLTDAMAWFDCQVEELVTLGDHTLVAGQVLAGGVVRDAEPLTNIITGWTYCG